jgi:hypothetical protein
MHRPDLIGDRVGWRLGDVILAGSRSASSMAAANCSVSTNISTYFSVCFLGSIRTARPSAA